MSGWVAKRFWASVDVVEASDGFGVSLDGRPVRTPSKAALICPTPEMAGKVAEEWRTVGEIIDPSIMPWTRSANSAIDKVHTQRREVEQHLVGYAGTDLVCYRADGPQSLIERQATTWGPLIDWVSDTYGLTFCVTSGVMPVDQPKDTLDRIGHLMSPMSDFELTGFHDLVTLSGSFVIALATLAGRGSPEALWTASRLDEEYQAEQWGRDDEAEEQATLRKLAFLHAVEFFNLAKKSGSFNTLRT